MEKAQIDQAHKVLDEVLAGLQLNRREHHILQQSLMLLYSEAKDNQEKQKEKVDG